MVRLLLLALNLVPELALRKAAFIFTGSGSRVHLQRHMSPGTLCLIQHRIDYFFIECHPCMMCDDYFCEYRDLMSRPR